MDRNRLMRIMLILKLPHTILINLTPNLGIAEMKFVITISL